MPTDLELTLAKLQQQNQKAEETRLRTEVVKANANLLMFQQRKVNAEAEKIMKENNKKMEEMGKVMDQIASDIQKIADQKQS